MTASVDETLRARVKNLDAMPAMPAILGPLLQCLELPAEQVEIEKLTELISRDKSIAAQCLRMANSALFSRRTAIETVRGAVVSLGVRRLHDILWTSFLLGMASPIATAASFSPNIGRSRRTFKASSNFITRRKPLLLLSPWWLAIVNLSDVLCRLCGMGYGNDEMCQVDFHEAPAWALLQKSVPQIDTFDIARFTFELDAGAEEIRQLVAVAFQS